MAFVTYALLLLQLSLLLSSISLTVYGSAPAETPHPHHHHHHHHGPAPAPSPGPVKHNPPVHPPVKPPVHPPVKPPVHPPVKPPVHPPVKPPVHPPVKPPTKPPVHPPVKPPSYPPAKPPHMPLPVRKLFAVQGVVYCKPCQYKGVNTLMKATPLANAEVKMQCNNTKYGMVEKAYTDKNGYFLFKPQKVTTMAFHKCKVFLVSSPVANCSYLTNLNGGAAGAILIPNLKPPVATSKYQYFNVGPFAFDPPKCY